MKNFLKLSVFFVIVFFLSGCAPEPGAIPSVEEVVSQREETEKEITDYRVKEYCYEQGGSYEDWDNKDGTFTTFCILPEGYGCDPLEFYLGNCALMEL